MNHLKAVVRLSLFTVSTLLLYSLWWVVSFVIPNRLYWRQAIFKKWCDIFRVISGMKLEIVGTPPPAPFFLVSNHVSYADIPALRLAANCVFVAKSEIGGWPVAGRIVTDMGNIFIDRSNRRDIPRAAGTILHHLDLGEGVVLFAEGTSTKGDKVYPFRTSFFQFATDVDLPVHYATITYATPAGSPAPSELVCWWGDTEFMPHLYRLFGHNGFKATVRFGEAPVFDADRKKLAVQLHQKVSENFLPMD